MCNIKATLLSVMFIMCILAIVIFLVWFWCGKIENNAAEQNELSKIAQDVEQITARVEKLERESLKFGSPEDIKIPPNTLIYSNGMWGYFEEGGNNFIIAYPQPATPTPELYRGEGIDTSGTIKLGGNK